MKEIRDIVRAFEEATRQGKRTALATVVCVEGSSYRRPGARMLVTEDGQLTGAISGGCLEGDALRKALGAIARQENRLVTYDTTHEDDAKLGIQLGCNGIVHILFEPIPLDADHHAMTLLRQIHTQRRDAVLVTLFSKHTVQSGTRLLHLDKGIHSNLPSSLQLQIERDTAEALYNRTSFLRQYELEGQELSALIEFIPPPIAVVIAGAGNDVLPLVALCNMLGWPMTIADGRPTHATRQRFPQADKIIVAKPHEVLAQVEMDARTVFLLMTHNYNYDLALLSELLSHDCAYIGVLGPRRKLEQMLGELADQGITLNDVQRAALHGPVGLDIGAETAGEIAVSIVAEIQAALCGGNGKPLKEKKQPIHSRLLSAAGHD